MGRQTEDETVRAAKKPHRCSWCAEKINIGESYIRYRWYESGDAGTVKLHTECHGAMHELISLEGGHQVEFTPGDNPRGCLCGYDLHCEMCVARKLKSNALSLDTQPPVS